MPDGAPRPPSPYERYLDAAWGLRNHWYPALFSHELADGGAAGIIIAGEAILLRRAKGRVYALSDTCIHRGVKISARPTCLTDETVTCWYHGFTYDLASGKLVSVVAAPDDKLIGKAKIRTYPSEEVNGMIFVFVGDEDANVPPLATDMPIRREKDYAHPVAHPLDDNAMLLGIRRTIGSNWRLAAENGIDPGHVLIHRDNDLVLSLEMAFPLGEKPLSGNAIRLYEGDGTPKAVEYLLDAEHMELVLENKELGLSNTHIGTNILHGLRTTLHLPCLLMVENWPKHGMVQYEWYVPLDDKTHHYWQVLAVPCNSETERRNFAFKFENLWKDLALTRGFNDADVFARVEMQPFYESGRGWDEEVLCSLDAVLVAWRRLVAKHARAIQPPPRRGQFATA